MGMIRSCIVRKGVVPIDTDYIVAERPVTMSSYIFAAVMRLYENRILLFDINMLRSHVFVGAIHELPLPGNNVFTNFMNMKLRFVIMKLRFHHSLCRLRAWGFIRKFGNL